MRRIGWLLVGLLTGLAIACGGPDSGSCGGAGGRCVPAGSCSVIRSDGSNPCGSSRLVCCVSLSPDGGSRD